MVVKTNDQLPTYVNIQATFGPEFVAIPAELG
jgi:hypothetical protein